jgi:lysophospholipase L1-like esterase
MSKTVSSYAALGDSFTCGLDPSRDLPWPHHVAQALGCGRHANLAAVGATSGDVERDQLGPALDLQPELVSLICGANDVLETVRPDAGSYAERLSRMITRIREEAPQAALLTATYPDLARFVPLRERTLARVRRGTEAFNEIVRGIATEHDVVCLEWGDHPGLGDRGNFAHDGFHPSPDGHRRAAADVLRALEERLGIAPKGPGASNRRPKEEAA